MFGKKRLIHTAIITVITLFISFPVFAQNKLSQAKPVLWEPVNISKRDLYLGPGGRKMLPDTSKITFIKEKKGGSSKKFLIKDGKDREWVAKVNHEAQAETAAVRLVWALGYKTEINYLVPELEIPGVGTYKNVRLEARPENVDREGRWNWKDNPFNGTDQLTGLKILMAMFNNWDLKTESNNIILEVRKGNRTETQYVISDLGATFGRTGYVNLPIIWRFGRHKNKPEDYADSKFIDQVKNDRVEFSYAGRNPDLFDNIKVRDTAWITGLLSQLSDRQIRDAFRAANYRPEEITSLTRAVQRKISELKWVNSKNVARK